MTKLRSVSIVIVLLAGYSAAQLGKPPHVLGRNDVRIKTKNFLVGKKLRHASTYEIFNEQKPGGVSIDFNKKDERVRIRDWRRQQHPVNPTGQATTSQR